MGKRLRRFDQTIEFLYGQLALYQKCGPVAIKKGLDNIRAICTLLDNPYNRYPTIHIAGTNGKGSVSHMIASILQALGLRVGMYTSPHYRDFRERIKINAAMVPKRWVTGFVNKNRSFIDQINPTFFELSVAMAFQYFAEQAVDIAVIETGMGGRLDSTNVIQPVLSVITNISFDHQASLGNSLSAIAREKAGIIKFGVPVVIGEMHPETDPVFASKALRSEAPIYWAEQMFELDLLHKDRRGMRFKITNLQTKNETVLFSDVQAGYQTKNLRTALSAMDVIRDRYPTTDLEIKTALERIKPRTGFIGRFQILREEALIVADAAHNEAGIQALLDSFDAVKWSDAHIVLGMVRDKNPEKLLALFPKEATYYFCKPKVPRGLDVEVLQEYATRSGLLGKAYSTVGRALGAAKRSVKSPDQFILITGSSYVIAEVI